MSARAPTVEPIPGTGPGTPGEPLEWTFNPWRERAGASSVALGFVVFSLALLWSLEAPPLARVALGAAVAWTLAPLLLPVRCRIDEAGLGTRGPLGWERRRWADVRRVDRVRAGLLASPFASPRRLDAFRSLVLPLPRRERGALAARIAPRLARHGL